MASILTKLYLEVNLNCTGIRSCEGVLWITPILACVILPNSLGFIDVDSRSGYAAGVDMNSNPEFKF